MSRHLAHDGTLRPLETSAARRAVLPPRVSADLLVEHRGMHHLRHKYPAQVDHDVGRAGRARAAPPNSSPGTPTADDPRYLHPRHHQRCAQPSIDEVMATIASRTPIVYSSDDLLRQRLARTVHAPALIDAEVASVVRGLIITSKPDVRISVQRA